MLTVLCWAADALSSLSLCHPQADRACLASDARSEGAGKSQGLVVQNKTCSFDAQSRKSSGGECLCQISCRLARERAGGKKEGGKSGAMWGCGCVGLSTLSTFPPGALSHSCVAIELNIKRSSNREPET